MAQDSDFLRRRAAEARAAASTRDHGELSEISGQLALAYAALARRRAKSAAVEPPATVEEPPLLLAD